MLDHVGNKLHKQVVPISLVNVIGRWVMHKHCYDSLYLSIVFQAPQRSISLTV